MKLPNTPRKTRNKMSIFGMYRISKVVTAIVISLVVFNFLHSELGFLDYDSNQHGAHDYCEIVKTINSHNKTLKDELPKLELKKDLNVYSFDEIQEQLLKSYFNNTDHSPVLKKSKDAYLFNQVFLI